MLAPTKLQASLQIAHLSRREYIVMPPAGIPSERYEAHHRCASPGRLRGFLDPLGDHGAIGRVAPADALPDLLEAILHWRVEHRAFGVLWEGTDIEAKAKFRVKPIKEGLRCAPQVGIAAKVHRTLQFLAIRAAIFRVGLDAAFKLSGSASCSLVHDYSVASADRKYPSLLSCDLA
jgi:hypothetical protein